MFDQCQNFNSKSRWLQQELQEAAHIGALDLDLNQDLDWLGITSYLSYIQQNNQVMGLPVTLLIT